MWLRMRIIRILTASLLFVGKTLQRFNYCFSGNFPNKSMDRIYWIIKATTAANLAYEEKLSLLVTLVSFVCNIEHTSNG